MLILTGAFAVVFALIHLFIRRLKFLDVVPRSRWLSFAGGVAVAYVFLYIMPELSTHQKTFARELEVSPVRRKLYSTLSLCSDSFFLRPRMLCKSDAQSGREG